MPTKREPRRRMVAYVHDHPLRWRVTSVSRPDIEHVVEIDAFHGNGACSCEHFEFRLAPVLRDGLMRRGRATRCSHILVAREAFTNFMIQRLVSAERAQAMQTTEPCPACTGGELEDGSTCTVCNGTGAIPTPE